MIHVEEHRPGTRSHLAMKKILREYNRTHPKPDERWPSGWWIAPGLMVAILAVAVAVIVL